MRYVSQLRRKHTSLYAVLRLSICKTMNACNGVVERPADNSWLIAGNVWSSIKFNVSCVYLCVCVWLYGCVCIQLLRFGSRLLYLFTRHNKFLLASILRFKSAAVISHHIHSFTSSQIRVSDPDFCAWLVRTLEVYVYVRVHSVLEKSLKMLEFGIKTSRYLKVLENR